MKEKQIDKILIFFVLLIFATRTYAQNSKISIYPEFISICIGKVEKINSCNSIISGDSIPISINFILNIDNLSNKKYMSFGTNSYNRYYGIISEIGLNDTPKEMGYFILINDKDTITLFSQHKTLLPIKDRSFQIVCSIEDVYSFNQTPQIKSFFCKLLARPKEYKSFLYNYIKESNILYIPILKDYQNTLNEKYSDKKDCTVYPDTIINVDFIKPLSLIISDCEDTSESASYEFYTE